MFVKELRKNTKPMIIAANKADLCQDLDILKQISDTVIPCSAETELLLRKASKSGIIRYSSGDEWIYNCEWKRSFTCTTKGTGFGKIRIC